MAAPSCPSSPEPAALAPAAVADLRRTLGSAVVHPHDPRYAALAGGSRAAAVVVASDAAVVERATMLAAAHGLLIGAGRGRSRSSAVAGGLLLHTGRLREVRVDPTARTAVVGAGASWRDLLHATAAVGLVCSPAADLDASVAGSVIHGRSGPAVRRLGVCSDAVRGLEVVTPDGGMRRVGPTSAPGLFRALRGGGRAVGDAGVVVLRLHVELVVDVGASEVVLRPDERAAPGRRSRALSLGSRLGSWDGLPDDVDVALRTGADGSLSSLLARVPGRDHVRPAVRDLVAAARDVVGCSRPLRTRSGSLAALLLGSSPTTGPVRSFLVEPGRGPDLLTESPGVSTVRCLGGAGARGPVFPDAVVGREHDLAVDVPVGVDEGRLTGLRDPESERRPAVLERFHRPVRHVASGA